MAGWKWSLSGCLPQIPPPPTYWLPGWNVSDGQECVCIVLSVDTNMVIPWLTKPLVIGGIISTWWCMWELPCWKFEDPSKGNIEAPTKTLCDHPETTQSADKTPWGHLEILWSFPETWVHPWRLQTRTSVKLKGNIPWKLTSPQETLRTCFRL